MLKGRVRRGKLTDAEALSSKVTECSEDVPIEQIKYVIQHLIDVFPNTCERTFVII